MHHVYPHIPMPPMPIHIWSQSRFHWAQHYHGGSNSYACSPVIQNLDPKYTPLGPYFAKYLDPLEQILLKNLFPTIKFVSQMGPYIMTNMDPTEIVRSVPQPSASYVLFFEDFRSIIKVESVCHHFFPINGSATLLYVLVTPKWPEVAPEWHDFKIIICSPGIVTTLSFVHRVVAFQEARPEPVRVEASAYHWKLTAYAINLECGKRAEWIFQWRSKYFEIFGPGGTFLQESKLNMTVQKHW